MRNQCGMFYSLDWEYEFRILRISVKLPYPGIYFTEKHASSDVHDLQYR